MRGDWKLWVGVAKRSRCDTAVLETPWPRSMRRLIGRASRLRPPQREWQLPVLTLLRGEQCQRRRPVCLNLEFVRLVWATSCFVPRCTRCAPSGSITRRRYTRLAQMRALPHLGDSNACLTELEKDGKFTL